MMPRILILLFVILIVSSASSQNILNQLQGDWICYNIEMKNGKALELEDEEKQFIGFTFKGNKLTLNTSPVEKGKISIDFLLKENMITILKKRALIIEKITQDSLILAEDFNVSKKKLHRYYFINRKSAIKAMQTENKGRGQFVATPLCAPQTIKRIGLNLPSRTFRANGKLIIDLTNKTVRTILDSCTVTNQNFRNSLIEYFNQSYDFWDLVDFKQFKTIEIPFFAGCTAGNNRINVFMMRVTFVVNTLGFNTDSPVIDNYTEGLFAFNEGDYKQAIEYFTKAYEEDNKNFEALHNRASIEYYLGNKEKACEDWKLLSKLKHVKSRHSYTDYCEYKGDK